MLPSRFSSCRYGAYAKCTCDANLLVPIYAIKCLISERMLGGKESGARQFRSGLLSYRHGFWHF